jgi:beta-lactamase superfamily II metal-dependent hydrolase
MKIDAVAVSEADAGRDGEFDDVLKKWAEVTMDAKRARAKVLRMDENREAEKLEWEAERLERELDRLAREGRA